MKIYEIQWKSMKINQWSLGAPGDQNSSKCNWIWPPGIIFEASWKMRNLEMEPCRYIQRHSETFRDIPRHSETFRNIQRHSETSRHIQRHSMEPWSSWRPERLEIRLNWPPGILFEASWKMRNLEMEPCRNRYSETFRDIQTHSDTFRDIQTHSETFRDIQRHPDTFKDFQWSPGALDDQNARNHFWSFLENEKPRNGGLQTDSETFRD